MQLQQNPQANQMEIKFGDRSKKDKPSDAVRHFIKSQKVTVKTEEGENEAQLFHWNRDDKAWGMRIDRDLPRLPVEADSIRRLERLGLAARDRERPFAEALTLSR